MKESLRQLLGGIIDYAGLFPPASQPMSEAVAAYAAYLRGPYAWLLSRFVCPAARLQELHACAFADGGSATDGQAPPWKLTVLGRGGTTTAEFGEALRADFDLCRGFVDRCAGRAMIDAFEVRLPPTSVGGSPAVLNELLYGVESLLHGDRSPPGVAPSMFFEVPLATGTETRIESLITSVAAFNTAGRAAFKLKIRTGGVEASAVPEPGLVAHFIALCAAHRVGFKATAGLHHPLRHDSPSIRGPMHGFLNVFVGAVLAWDRSLDETRLRELLGDERAENFRFEDDRLGWREVSADLRAVRRARTDFALGFGSCSLMEPVSDLTGLGLYTA